MNRCLQQSLRRDLLLAFRRPMDYIEPLLFFLMVITLFPLAITPNPKMLALIGPGVIWVALLLSILLSLPKLFGEDYASGWLEYSMLNSNYHHLQALVKLLTHFCLIIIPILIISPLFGLLYQLTPYQVAIIDLSVLIGSVQLIFLGALGSTLTLNIRNNSIILTLIILPFYIPTLIFANLMIYDAFHHLAFLAPLFWLLALMMLAVTIVPWVIPFLLRMALD